VKAGLKMTSRSDVSSFESVPRKTIKIRTTLFDLLNILNEEAGIGEEKLIARLVCDWIESGKVKFIPH
jgi:hypothetical protein